MHAHNDDPELQQALDRVASCAAVTLGVPLGAVSLLDGDRLTFAGRHGFEQGQTVRRGSFCEAVVRDGGTLLLADAAQDPRFREHPFVAEGGVRAYAGAAIQGSGGEAFGSVEVFAGEPGVFQPASLFDLEALSHMVSLLLVRAGPADIALPRLRGQGWIGVRTLDASRAGTASRAGLTVLSVARGSPAERGGLRATDVLYAVDDLVLRERADLVAALADREPGSSARITFQRAGAWLERSIPVATRQARRASATGSPARLGRA